MQTSFGPALAAQPKRPMSFLLYFDEGSEELTVESKATFDSVFKEIAAYPVPDIVVIGHTDAVGNDSVNDALSKRRAETVAHCSPPVASRRRHRCLRTRQTAAARADPRTALPSLSTGAWRSSSARRPSRAAPDVASYPGAAPA